MSVQTQQFWAQASAMGHMGVSTDRRDVLKHNEVYTQICGKDEPNAPVQLDKPKETEPVRPKTGSSAFKDS